MGQGAGKCVAGERQAGGLPKEHRVAERRKCNSKGKGGLCAKVYQVA